jgi:uncharacterized glyoxalase superfamily protein PhnB
MPRLDAFGVVVEDMSEAIRFYTLLGLDIEETPADASHVDIELGSGMRLMLDSADLIRSMSDWQTPSGGHRVGLAFRCDDPAEVDSTHAVIIGAGFRSIAEPFDAFWGQRYATVSDPDGNPVDLYAAL